MLPTDRFPISENLLKLDRFFVWKWAVDSWRRLPVRELVVVLYLLFQTVKLGLERVNHRLLCRVIVEIVHFRRILQQIVKFPLVPFPKINQFVSFSSHAVMRSSVMITGIVIVPVIESRAPVGRAFASHQRYEAPALHIRRNCQAGCRQESRRKIRVNGQ
jgi:hypothetical protein